MTCSSATDALRNDLKLYQDLLWYKVVNKLISKSAIRALKKHLWYVTETVPIALFGSKMPPEEKRALVDKLLVTKPTNERASPLNRFGTGFGKPVFPLSHSVTYFSRSDWVRFMVHISHVAAEPIVFGSRCCRLATPCCLSGIGCQRAGDKRHQCLC